MADVALAFTGDQALDRDARALLRFVAAQCIYNEGIVLPCAVDVLITDDDGIRSVNRAHRGVDRATDVLSFPLGAFSPGNTAGSQQKRLRRLWDDAARACMLGDIVISLERAVAQAAEYGHDLRRELAYLTVHGLLHLLGYDHMNNADKERMRAMEERALNSAGATRQAVISDEELIARARAAMQMSYSPYSGFKVGACLLAGDGRVFTGCNIENASFGATNCAERTALFKAVSEGARGFTVLAIATEKALAWPCGICRQALNEFAPRLRVITCCGNQREECALDKLLPHGFGPNNGTDDYLRKG